MTHRSSPVRGESGEIIGAVEVITSNTKRINVLKEVEALRMSRRLPGPFPD